MKVKELINILSNKFTGDEDVYMENAFFYGSIGVNGVEKMKNGVVKLTYDNDSDVVVD